MWKTILSTLRDELSDLSDTAQLTRVVARLFIAVLLAAIIGYERERNGHAAGLRTHMMVALGVVLFVISAQISGIAPADMSRVLQGIMTGLGFLGAGAIIKQSDTANVKGLTTAASIWATAAIATAAGLGREATAILATVFALIILALLRRFEHRDDKVDSSSKGRADRATEDDEKSASAS